MTKSNSSQDDFEEIKVSFLTEVVETVDINDIPPELNVIYCLPIN